MIQQMQHGCSDSKGSTKTISEKDKCTQCRGEKVVQDSKMLEVHVEKGMQHNQKITILGEADEALDTVTRDIVCVLQLKEHAKFKRKGDDLFVEHTLNLKEAPCGFKFVIVHLDGRKLLIKPTPGEIVKPGQFKTTDDKGMPMYQRTFIKGKLYIHFFVGFLESGSLSTDQCKALEAILPLKPLSEMTNMELGECDKTILQNVNLEKKMRKQQRQQSQKVQEDQQEAKRSRRTRKSPRGVLRKNDIGPQDQQQNDISGQDEDNSKNVWTKPANKHLGGEPDMNARKYVMSFQFCWEGFGPELKQMPYRNQAMKTQEGLGSGQEGPGSVDSGDAPVRIKQGHDNGREECKAQLWQVVPCHPMEDKEMEVALPGGNTFVHSSPLVFASCGHHEDLPTVDQSSVDIYKGPTKILPTGTTLTLPATP
ncbi:hypothetical protein L7F22_054795 [Adiantum nelumboides]|nr:hypothetical protein [Adiantum nelumboides]